MEATDDAEPVGDRTAHGTIRDDQGNPIPGVTLEIADKTTTTDALGNWEINGLVDETTYTVTASKDGYTFAPTTVDIGNETLLTNVTITPLTTLKLTAKPNIWQAINQGEDLTYTFTVTNGGQQTATGVTLTEQLPAGATLVSLTTSDGTCDLATTSCTLSDLTPGATATVTMTLNAMESGTLKNVANLTATEYPVDVQTSWKRVIPHLSVAITDIPDPVVMQSSVHYQLDVTLSDKAPIATATGVQLDMQLPKGVELIKVTTADGTCEATALPRISCQLNDLSIESADRQSRATIAVDVKLEDAGLLVLTKEAKVTAKEYPSHLVREATKIFIPDDAKVDAIIVLDTTFSMNPERNSIVAGIQRMIDNKFDRSNFPLTALVEFKDEVTLKALTNDPQVLSQAVASLQVEGGGLCPEASFEALELATKHIQNGGVIFFTTDASPYEQHTEADLLNLAQRLKNKTATFTAVISGDCQGQESWNEGDLDK
jgi:uncharacterized repeat protein (TIGR01451 family)